tara:strand:- start:146 stop:397 length:252 start_codon:yes stop_codon:yes gene_type:complete
MNNDEYNNWIDYVLDGEPDEANIYQIGIIEGLQITSGYVWTGNPETLTYLEAEELIIKLKENEIKTDPQDQYKQMFRSGMFNG